MSRNYLIAYILIILIVTPVHAGYREMKKEIDTYAPRSFVAIPDRPTTAPVDSPVDQEFEASLQNILDIKSKWERLINSDDEGYTFLKPDIELIEALRPAASDPYKTAEKMKAEYSLKILEALVLLRNPGIKAAANRFRAAIETFSQVSSLDEILRQYTALTEGQMTGVGPTKGKDPVSMKFPFPGVLALKGQIVDQEVKAARESLEATRRNIVTLARKTYWDLLFVRNAQKVAGETVDLLNHLEAVATTRYEAGRTSFQDVVKVRIKRETLEEDLVTLKEKQRNLEQKIREVLNLPHQIRLGHPLKIRPATKRLPLDTLYDMALKHRQELRKLRARVGKMERMVEMAETMILPPYTLNLSLYEDEAVKKVGTVAMSPTFPVSVQASTGAGLPKMPWYGANDAYLRQTRKKLLALREDLKKAEVTAITMVRNSWFKLDQANREKDLYKKTIIDLSQAALDVSIQGYESGTVTFADVIASHTLWLATNLTLERKQADVGIAWSDLQSVVGISMN
jgi:cobalt-zinc-cadmium efflux system outer membrane protein